MTLTNDTELLCRRYESFFLSAYLGELGDQFWIGLSGTIGEDGSRTFTWINNDSVHFTNWGNFEPSDMVWSQDLDVFEPGELLRTGISLN